MTAAIKAHPIPFRQPMVLALLAGEKTQTRRVIKPSTSLFNGGPWPPKGALFYFGDAWVDAGPSFVGNPGPYLKLPYRVAGDDHEVVVRIYPRIQPGDMLWVKEAWSAPRRYDDLRPADLPEDVIISPLADGREIGRRRAAMYMPQRFSRLSLAVTTVRIHRIQDISEEDIWAEGIRPQPSGEYLDYSDDSWDARIACPRAAFKTLWDRLHAKAPWRRWAANPWVFAYSFAMHERNLLDALR